MNDISTHYTSHFWWRIIFTTKHV